MATDLTTIGQIEQRFPVGGPYSDDDARTAAVTINHLMRYLNHAALPAQAEETLGYPSTISVIADNLREASTRERQLLDQLANRLEQFAGDDLLYDDGMGEPIEGVDPLMLATARAMRSANSLRVAGGRLVGVSVELKTAFEQANRLGYR